MAAPVSLAVSPPQHRDGIAKFTSTAIAGDMSHTSQDSGRRDLPAGVASQIVREGDESGFVSLRPRTRAEMRQAKRDRKRHDKEQAGGVAERAASAFIAHALIPHFFLLKAALAGADKRSVEYRFGFGEALGWAVLCGVAGAVVGANVRGHEPVGGALIGIALSAVIDLLRLLQQKGYDRVVSAYHQAFCEWSNGYRAEMARARSAGEIQQEKRTTRLLNSLYGRASSAQAHMIEWAARSGEAARMPSKPKRMAKHHCEKLGCYTRDLHMS